nr:cold-inducible RNA-binding protein [Ipomoea trifida]GMD22035.1 cold-inducible RNA-binding protein [Ipomoea batatas]
MHKILEWLHIWEPQGPYSVTLFWFSRSLNLKWSFRDRLSFFPRDNVGRTRYIGSYLFYVCLFLRFFAQFDRDFSESGLVIDHRTQRPKGFGFVTFESETDAQNALKALNGKVHFSSCIAVTDLPLVCSELGGIAVSTQIINGRLIFVEVAKTARPGES